MSGSVPSKKTLICSTDSSVMGRSGSSANPVVTRLSYVCIDVPAGCPDSMLASIGGAGLNPCSVMNWPVRSVS